MNANAVAGERPASTSGLEAMVAGHLDLVYTAALRQVRDPHLAEDVTQTVFLTAARKIGSVPSDRTAAWLLKATHFIALTALRSQRRRRRHETSAAAPPTQMSIQPTEPAIDSTLDDALCALKESDRQIIILRYFKDLSVSEVAAWFRLKENSASKRIERALGRLHRELGRRGVGVTTAALGTAILAGAIRPAPKALGAQIAAAAGSAAPVGVPLGILLMTLSVKLKAFALLAVLALLLCGTVIAIEAVTRESQGPSALSPATEPAPPVAYADAAGTTTLRGVVLDPGGRPLADALITQGNYPNRSTRTDAGGRFVLHGIAIGQSLDLTAHAGGLAPQIIAGIVTINPEPFTFTLKPAQTIRAKIVDVRGKPIANLPIDPFYWRGKQVLRVYTFENQRWNGPKTDADGVFVWSDAPPDPVTFDPVTPKTFLRDQFTLSPSANLQTVVVRDAINVSMSVADGQTHAPIDHFTVDFGFGNSASPGGALWPTGRPGAGSAGKYRTTLAWSYPYHFFHIESPGYEPVTRSIDESQTQVSLVFELSRSSGMRLTILDPNGQPARKAHVYCVPLDKSFTLQEAQLLRDPRMAGGGEIPDLTADVAGQLTIPNPGEGARIVVLDKAGFVEISAADAAKAPIQLRAWAKVEGQAFVGAKPARNQEISLTYQSPHQGQPYIDGFFQTTTDDQGKFQYRYIPPGDCHIGIFVETNLGSQFQQGATNNPIDAHLNAGEVNQIKIGGSGRAIVGKIVGKDSRTIPDAVYSLGMLSADRTMQYVFAVASDGAFRLDDIKPGNYSLSIQISSGKTTQPIGRIQEKVAIDAGPSDGSDKPIDLGNLSPTP